MMRKTFILFSIMVATILVMLPSSSNAAPLLTVVAQGVDRDGAWAQSIIDIDGIDNVGVWLFTIRGDGGPYINPSTGSVTIGSTYFGSNYNASGLMDSAKGYGLWLEPYLYIYTSVTTDFDIIGRGSTYNAHMIVLRYDYNVNSLVLEKMYSTLYLSDNDRFGNQWFEDIPSERFEYTLQ